VALNLHMHGIDCGLDFADLSAVEEVYERCTGMSIDPRHPYAGELVFTAFSGSHQDAIKKALTEWKKREGKAHWDVPYLAIDPHDIGRTYSEVIRVNSQSGRRRSGLSFGKRVWHRPAERDATRVSDRLPMMQWIAWVVKSVQKS